MARSRTSLRSIAGTVTIVTAPSALIAIVLSLAGEMSWFWALLLIAISAAVLTPLIISHQRGLVRIAAYAHNAALRGDGTSRAVNEAPAESLATGTLTEVAAAVGRLARAAGDQRRSAEHDTRTNAMIVENLPNPLLLIDEDGEVVGANVAARAAFGERLIGADLTAVIRAPALLDAITDVLGGATKREIEFDEAVPVNRNFIAIVERLGAEGSDDGRVADGRRPTAMILFHDLTSLKRTEQLRAEFVANVSHELRTPLSALIGFVETLATTAQDDPSARERFLGLMDEQGRRMTRLIDDLLSLSNIEMDEHTRPAEIVDLSARVAAVVQALDQRAMRHGVSLVVEQPDGPGLIVGEADQVYEVIENLVENAIRYSRDNSIVRVRIWRAGTPSTNDASDGTIGMAVIDQGEGIPREHLPRITERFYRADKARSRAMGGTGLGLAIVKHIVSRHRAALQIESKVGEGSVFTVYWPAAPSAIDENAAE